MIYPYNIFDNNGFGKFHIKDFIVGFYKQSFTCAIALLFRTYFADVSCDLVCQKALPVG